MCTERMAWKRCETGVRGAGYERLQQSTDKALSVEMWGTTRETHRCKLDKT